MHQKKRTPLPFVQKLHDTHPKLAQTLSLGAGLGTMIANSVVVGIPLYGAGLAKTLLGSKLGDKAVLGITNHWINTNNFLLDKLSPQRDWRIHMPDDLKADGRYLLICNHQSWVDTSVVQYVSESRLPITRFFAKHELLYIPIVGQTFYFLDFPMMKRHSKEEIAKNPALATRDLEEVRRACQLLANKPFVLLNFLEGTRFDKVKHERQNSPYRHLLKPKAGGFALAIASLGEQIDGVLDMTLVYPDGVPDYGELWSGKLVRLGVDVRHLPMDQGLFNQLKAGKYDEDEAVKAELFDFLDEVWRQKDKKMEQMMDDFHQKTDET